MTPGAENRVVLLPRRGTRLGRHTAVACSALRIRRKAVGHVRQMLAGSVSSPHRLKLGRRPSPSAEDLLETECSRSAAWPRTSASTETGR
jgi:hypothetical protein